MKSRANSLDSSDWADYQYLDKIRKCLNKSKREFSQFNARLMVEYNSHMIRCPLAHATRLKHLQHFCQHQNHHQQ